MVNINGIEWWHVKYKAPPEKTLLMLTGDSGMRTHKKFLVLGYYDNEFRPPYPNGDIRWLDIRHDALLDRGYRPIYWALPIVLP